MARYVGWRLLLTVPIALGVSILVFITVKIIPGDPVASILGSHPTAAARAAVEHQYGLDKPAVIQYFYWLGHVVTGQFGTSISMQTPVLGLVTSAFGNTLILTAFASTVAVTGGVLLGALIAFSRQRLVKALGNGMAVISVSIPQYTLGVLLIVGFAVMLGWLPTGGMRNPIDDSGLFTHLVLPGFSAALVPMGIIARMFSAALAETATSGWVESLQARGLSRPRLMTHIVYASISSLLTIAGLQIGYLLGGVFYVEVIFSWPGLGQLVFESISKRDLPVIQAGVLVSAIAFVLLNFVIDLARASIDPRIRQRGAVA